MMPEDPLVARVARGERVPTEIRERTKSGWATRALRPHEKASLERLARAHRRDDMAPFEEALDSGSLWVREIALHALPYARIGEGGFEPLGVMPHVRRVDFRRVARLLPQLIELARSNLGVPGVPNKVAVRARSALRLIAARSEFPSEANRAFVAYFELAAADHDDAESWRGVTEILCRRPELKLDADKLDVVRAHVMHDLSGSVRRTATLELIVRLKDLKLLDHLHGLFAQQRSYVPWLQTLAECGYSYLSRHILAALQGDPTKVARIMSTAVRVPSAEYIPYIEKDLKLRATLYDAGEHFAALAAIGGLDAAAVLKRFVNAHANARQETDVEMLGRALESLIICDPSAVSWIEPMATERTGHARMAIVLALAKTGSRALFSALRMHLAGAVEPRMAYETALEALTQHLQAPRTDGALGLVHQLLRRFHPKLDPTAFVGSPREDPWWQLLAVVRNAGVNDAKTESLLLEWFAALPEDNHLARTAVAKTLAVIGGAPSLAALRPLCAYPKPPDVRSTHMRLGIRAFVGQLESRVEK